MAPFIFMLYLHISQTVDTADVENNFYDFF